jgi:hypothetical protein
VRGAYRAFWCDDRWRLPDRHHEPPVALVDHEGPLAGPELADGPALALVIRMCHCQAVSQIRPSSQSLLTYDPATIVRDPEPSIPVQAPGHRRDCGRSASNLLNHGGIMPDGPVASASPISNYWMDPRFGNCRCL